MHYPLPICHCTLGGKCIVVYRVSQKWPSRKIILDHLQSCAMHLDCWWLTVVFILSTRLQNCNADYYVTNVISKLVVDATSLMLDGFIFQQDGAPAHCACNARLVTRHCKDLLRSMNGHQTHQMHSDIQFVVDMLWNFKLVQIIAQQIWQTSVELANTRDVAQLLSNSVVLLLLCCAAFENWRKPVSASDVSQWWVWISVRVKRSITYIVPKVHHLYSTTNRKLQLQQRFVS